VGADGMTAEQILRAASIKQAQGFNYEELTFHLAAPLGFVKSQVSR